MNAIEIKNLCKSYGDFSIKDLNLVLPEGCILGLAGENGAGKSTTIKLIMNAVKKDSGKITVLGTDNGAKEFTDLKNDIGIVLDECHFSGILNSGDIGKIMAATYKNWDSAAYAGYLRRFSLPENKQIKDFSRGMKMKLSIATALSHKPKLLILDEATSGLDPLVRDEILELFFEFTRDEHCSVLFSSHIVSDMEKICDYFGFLHKGKLILLDEKDKILEEYAVLKLSEEEFEALPKDVVHGFKKTGYGVDCLVERGKVGEGFRFEHTSLEDIIIFLAKEEISQ